MNTRFQRIFGYALLLVSVLPASAPADAGQPVRLSAPVVTSSEFETFGAPLPETDEVLSLADLLSGADDYLGRLVLVETRIAQVCQKKGCFFIAQEGPAIARVSFKDYGFFVPSDSAGKRVRLAGVLQRELVGTGEAQHMNQDLGQPEEPVREGPSFAIVASSVRIPRN
jgi:hypothetical protein